MVMAIPSVVDDLRPSEPPPSCDPLDPQPVRAAMPLVLLVEDDRSMRRYLTTTLTDQRLRVVDARTGAEGLVQAYGHNPDLILLDMVLPDMDGIHVTTKLREWTVAPIVIVSASFSRPAAGVVTGRP